MAEEKKDDADVLPVPHDVADIFVDGYQGISFSNGVVRINFRNGTLLDLTESQ